MEEYPGQTPAPQTPPPPAYTPPAPQYAPQQPQYAQPVAPKKKKTWLWIVLGVVLLGLLGCCIASVLGGKALWDFASGPSEAIDAMNQAALDGDQAEFEKYFDAEAVAENSYEDILAYAMEQEDYQALVDEVGEEEAERILREEYLKKEDWVSEMSDTMSLSGNPDEDVPFPNYTIDETSIDNATAELTVTADSEDGRMQYVLGFVQEDYEGETIWRLKEIKNFAELMEEEGEL